MPDWPRPAPPFKTAKPNTKKDPITFLNGPRKVMVIGNSGGGKSRLSRLLSKKYDLPLTHVDSLQFLPGMKIRPQEETRKALRAIEAQERWLIDGYGPLDLIENRFRLADQIVLVDFPLWRHALWCAKRQLLSPWFPRQELPAGCDEATWGHTKKLFKTLWQVHTKMRPELLRILTREEWRAKVIVLRSLSDWNKIAD